MRSAEEWVGRVQDGGRGGGCEERRKARSDVFWRGRARCATRCDDWEKTYPFHRLQLGGSESIEGGADKGEGRSGGWLGERRERC